MTKESFNLNFAALLAAFPNNKASPQSQDVYWMMLKDIPEEMFEKAFLTSVDDP